ncbi:HAMP domain-containing protein [Asticcacaulis sp. AND118]|uniref:HAMP domain-containing protein n=1 Tax=Asticcacaulis sp. AND118 TaxID=2840468 RepID=UPI001CFF8393|nr:HAMP domain-containing protein [Asticcacaulis sp. AND118]UDF02908.1 HAMP domain-containing protein [Asticcacaulis sp. AND118]
MSIRLRLMALIASFGVMSLIITGLALMSLQRYKTMMGEYGAAYEHAYDIQRMNYLVSNVVMESRGVYIAQSPAEARTYARNLSHNLDAFQNALGVWQRSDNPEARRRYATIAPAARDFINIRRELVRLAEAGQQAEAMALGISSRQDRIRLQERLDLLVTEARRDLTRTQAQAAAFSEKRGQTFLIVALLSIASIVGVSTWLILHFITRPLRQVAGTIIGLSEGKLDTPVPESQGKDEMADVWRALARLKAHAIEAEKIVEAQRETERQQALEARQLILD